MSYTGLPLFFVFFYFRTVLLPGIWRVLGADGKGQVKASC